MDSNKELEKLLDKNTSLIDKLHKCLINGNVEIPKELEAEVKKLTLHDVVVPKGALCNCNSIKTDELRHGVNWRTCNDCGISRIA